MESKAEIFSEAHMDSKLINVEPRSSELGGAFASQPVAFSAAPDHAE